MFRLTEFRLPESRPVRQPGVSRPRRRLPHVARLTAHLVAAAALLALAACQSLTAGTYLNCPAVAFLGGAEHITQFNEGPGRGVVDIAVEADLDNLGAECRFSAERVELDLSFDIVAVRGVDLQAAAVDVPFFVAVTDASGQVLVKTPFVASIPLAAGAAAATWTEELTQEILLTEGQRSRSFEVLIGFQLTAEQLEYNFARRAAR